MSAWLAFGLITVVVVLVLVRTLFRRRDAAVDRAGYDLQVYQDQLDELAADRARGLINAAQAQAARTEIERRILAADSGSRPAAAGDGAGMKRIGVGVVGLGVPAVAVAIYLAIGSPTAPDQPLASRDLPGPTQTAMPAGFDEAIARVKARLKENPTNVEDWTLLARSYAFTEQFDAAINAYREAAALAPDDIDIAVGLGESIVFAAQGQITPAARQQFEHVRSLQPDHGIARYYLALSRAQAGDLQAALDEWTALAEALDPSTPWLPDLQAQIRRTAAELGVEAPAVVSREMAAPGPTADDMAAAADMTAEDRQAMIRGMVERLAARLADQPDDVEGWRRLANARKVLGETEAARDAYARLVALVPNDIDALSGYGEVLVSLADPPGTVPAEAVETFTHLLSLDPGSPAALWFLGLAAVNERRDADAVAYWSQLLERLPVDSQEHGILAGRIAELNAASNQ